MLSNKKEFLTKCIVLLFLFLYGLSVLLAVRTDGVAIGAGEYDDFSIPVASLINTHDFGINESDHEFYSQLFPKLKDLPRYLSGYETKGGSGEMTFYFPTYSIFCVPATLVLYHLNLNTTLAFPITNIAFWMLSVAFVALYLKVPGYKRYLLALMLLINPVVHYSRWISAEMVIFSLIVIGLTCWHNRWHKGAAVFISLAGTINPTVMAIGIVMIVDFLIEWFRSKGKDEAFMEYFKHNVWKVISYGCCYFIGLFPFGYAYYNTGHFNLPASYPGPKISETTLQRMVAYIFDLNYGLLPYFVIPLILFVIIAIKNIVKKNITGIIYIFVPFALMFSYSIMIHINCGMTGISRYNAWGSSVVLFYVVIYFSENIKLRKIVSAVLAVGILLTGLATFQYGRSIYIKEFRNFSPIAKTVLENAPWAYNPLYSTFRSRTIHHDGCYEDTFPHVYVGDDGLVHKILATEENRERLLEKYSSEDHNDEFVQLLDSLTEKPRYINVPSSYHVKPVEE